MAAKPRLNRAAAFDEDDEAFVGRVLAPAARDPYLPVGGRMLDRGGLVVQMAKVIAGERVLDPTEPDEQTRRRADEALARVELFLGVDVDEARDILTRVLHDVS